MWLALLATTAFAYETDQLTDRALPLADAAPAADAKMDEILQAAIDATNRKTWCSADDAGTRRILAGEIYDRTAYAERIPSRGLVRQLGFGAYAAWLETAPIDRRAFEDRHDIYGRLSVLDSVVLALAGPASTIRIGDVLLGTDKLDHFLAEGYQYWWISQDGHHDDWALWFGTASEDTYFGLVTSRTFSYADLRANWDGYRFYRGLLGPDSVAVRGDDGCVVQARPWRWTEWVDWEYDEVMNPSVYTPRVQEGVRARLAEQRDAVCQGFQAWATPEYLARVAAVDGRVPPYAEPELAPPQRDPYGLEALCGSPEASVSDAGTR